MTNKKMAHRVLSKWRLKTNPLEVKFLGRGVGRIPKNAATIDDILSGLSNAVETRAKDVKVRVKDHPLPMDWDFKAFSTSGNDNYEVSVRALNDESESDLVKDADILIACSCPFWRWQGPEHHAQKGKYLFGNPRGTAATPTEKDPNGSQYVCKHAARVLDTIRFYIIGDYEDE